MSDRDTPGADDLSLPKATVAKIVNEVLAALPSEPSPASSKADKDSSLSFTRPARDVLISCCLEYIRMLSSEANDIAERKGKKTIGVEHIESALTELGFEGYITGCRDVVEEWQVTQKKRTARGEKMRDFGGKKGEVSEEELMRMQQELLAGAGKGGED